MQNPLPRITILLSLAATLACAEKLPPPEFAYDRTASFSSLKTYAWYDDPKWVMPDGNSIVDGQFIDRNVREAVNESLRKDGYVLVASGDATFYVAYHEGSAGSLSQGKWGVYSDATGSYVATESTGLQNEQANQFHFDLDPPGDSYAATKYQKKDTLVLDIRDSQKKLIWRGERTGLIGTNPGDLKKDIEHSVAVLLAKFPPKPPAHPH